MDSSLFLTFGRDLTPDSGQLDPTNKNTFWPISKKVKKILTQNNFYWLVIIKTNLLLKFNEENLSDVYVTLDIY